MSIHHTLALCCLLLSSCATPYATITPTPAHNKSTLDSVLTATSTASQALARNPKDPAALAAYNTALTSLFSTLQDGKIPAWEKPITISSPGGEWTLSGTSTLAKEGTARKIELIPADRIQVSGSYTKERNREAGLGAPLIAVVTPAGANVKKDPFAQGETLYYGITAVAQFQGRRCQVRFEDPLAVETTQLAGHRYPLAADFTAPLAVMLARENPKKIELSRLLSPAKFEGTARLARLQPYDPAKIPIICVHGLMDSPATWIPMINYLRADPQIRARYQFWFFSYPSGYPYPHSAAILRHQLDAIKKQYPGHKDAIVIGHSMGGCISRLLITDTGDQIWREVFGKSPAETRLSAATKKHFEDTLIFKKREDVSRVIFISAPLRGSDLATNWPARLASRLVRTPLTLLNLGQDALKAVIQSPDSLQLQRMPNSIDTMSPKNRFVQAINKIPPSTQIPYHVIVGDRGKGGNTDHTAPVKSDGFVPYWSSHMPGAQSECIVPSNHSAHQNPQAMAEVKRILRLPQRKRNLE